MVLLIKGKLAEYTSKAAEKLSTKVIGTRPSIEKSVVMTKMKLLTSDKVELTSRVGVEPFLISENLLKRATAKQRAILEDLYKNKFLILKKNRVLHPSKPILEKGSLLHGENYDPKIIDSILQDGLISIDLGKVIRKTENSQTTIGGVDTWVNDQTRNINEYFNKWLAECPEYATTPFQKMNRQMCWRGENKWIDLSSKNGNKVVFVVNPVRNTELQEITKYSVNPSTKGLYSTVMGGNLTNQAGNCMYDSPNFARHTFVPVGIPSNYFEKIIIGNKITPEQVLEIKNMVKKYGLDTKIFDTAGMLL